MNNNKIILCEKQDKKNKLRIFLDVDGVITNWIKAVAELIDVDMNDKDIREKLKKGYKFEEIVDIDEEQMWEKINKEGRKFWKNLELTPWAKKLVQEIKNTNNNLCFLTSPSSHASSLSGKKTFLDKYFQEINFIITGEKHFCAHPNALLIDDSVNKIKKFEDWGGNVFFWPDILSFEDKENDIDEVIQKLINNINNI